MPDLTTDRRADTGGCCCGQHADNGARGYSTTCGNFHT
jgi:hypothetical protein